mgnify:CR=1 FL=1
MYVYLNNKFVKKKEAKIQIDDKGFMYGYGIYEAILVHKNKPVDIESNLNRLKKSADELGLTVPKNLKKIIQQLAQKNQLKNSYIRVDLTPETILVNQSKLPDFRGRKAITYFDQRIKPEIKSTSIINAYKARLEAKKHKALEALLLDKKNYVLEGASANIFMVKKGKLITTTENALPGTSQQKVIEIAEKLNIKTKINRIPLKKLLKADEVFVTSALKLIKPITKIDSTQINDGKIGPITKLLTKELKKELLN